MDFLQHTYSLSGPYQGFEGSDENRLLFAWIWGELDNIIRALGSKHTIFGFNGAWNGGKIF